MSDSTIQSKIKDMLNDPRTAELLKNCAEPSSREEACALYAETAKKLGLDLTAEDFKAYLCQAEKTRKAETEQAAEAVRELSDEEMDKVIGGEACMNSYQDYENCWYDDACDNIFQIYNEYICHRGFFTDHCHETAVPCDHDYYYQN